MTTYLYCKNCLEPLSEGDLVIPVMEVLEGGVIAFKPDAWAGLGCVTEGSR